MSRVAVAVAVVVIVEVTLVGVRFVHQFLL